MTRVMAQGVFDLLHPGHLHYLRESAALGDELVVVIARDSRKEDKPLVKDEETRRRLVDALAVVDRAILGSEDDIFETVEAVRPDVITLGYDQEFEPDALEETLAAEGFPDVEVVRIDRYDGAVTSSSQLRERCAETA